jgi:hypothetical protein
MIIKGDSRRIHDSSHAGNSLAVNQAATKDKTRVGLRDVVLKLRLGEVTLSLIRSFT